MCFQSLLPTGTESIWPGSLVAELIHKQNSTLCVLSPPFPWLWKKAVSITPGKVHSLARQHCCLWPTTCIREAYQTAVVLRNPRHSTSSGGGYCFLLLCIADAAGSDWFLAYVWIFPPLPQRSSQVIHAGLAATLLSHSGRVGIQLCIFAKLPFFGFFCVGKIRANSDTPTCLSGCKYAPSAAQSGTVIPQMHRAEQKKI